MDPIAGPGAPLDASTGSLAASFPKVNHVIKAVAADGSGGWYIGGDFTTVGGLARNRLAHITAAGTVDAWNPGANSTVNALAVSGSTVYVGGGFTRICQTAASTCWNGSAAQTRSSLAAVDTDGTLGSWNPNANNVVNALAVSGSTVYAGGDFTTIGPSLVRYLAAFRPATTTALASSANPASPGQSVTLTATVSPATATGTVTFLDGETTLGSAALSNGSATLATSALSVGDHSLTATYAGDLTNAASSSSGLTQTIAMVNTWPTASAITYGQTLASSNLTGAPQTNAGNYTVTATVNDANYQGSASDTFVILQPVTVATNPAGMGITVDGTGYTAPQTFNWAVGQQPHPCRCVTTSRNNRNPLPVCRLVGRRGAEPWHYRAEFPGNLHRELWHGVSVDAERRGRRQQHPRLGQLVCRRVHA